MPAPGFTKQREESSHYLSVNPRKVSRRGFRPTQFPAGHPEYQRPTTRTQFLAPPKELESQCVLLHALVRWSFGNLAVACANRSVCSSQTLKQCASQKVNSFKRRCESSRFTVFAHSGLSHLGICAPFSPLKVREALTSFTMV